jgi:MFS family permease
MSGAAAPISVPKKWQVGTLTYTSASLTILFCWLLFGDFAWSMRDRSVMPMAQWYLNELKVSNLVFALLITSLPAIIAMTLVPVVSVKSDRHRGRRGRRIPFLMATTPMAAASMIGLGLTPVISAWIHGLMPEADKTLVALLCFGIFWTTFEVAALAGQAVFGGLINDVVPRPLIGRFHGLFRAVSLIDGIIFNFWLMGKVPTHFTLMLGVIGLFYGSAFMWMCYKVKEGDYPPPDEAAHGLAIASTRSGGVRVYLRECFSNRYYVSVFIFMTAAGLAFAPLNTFSIPYAKSLGVDMDHFGKYVALTFGISLTLAYFLGWLCDAFHPLRMTIATLAGYGFVMTWGFFHPPTTETFMVYWVAHGVLSGSYFTCVASLGQRLFPQSRFAQFASAVGIISGPTNIALAPLVGVLVDGSGNDYHSTYAVALSLASLAVLAGWMVHSKFMQLGGPLGYVAPE